MADKQRSLDHLQQETDERVTKRVRLTPLDPSASCRS
jgi:hypothetical protein